MKRVEVRLSIPAVAPLLDLIKAVADELRTTLAVPLALSDSDAELAAVWGEDLLESQRDDCDRLFSLFNQEFFSEGVVAFDRENAEPVLRACAAAFGLGRSAGGQCARDIAARRHPPRGARPVPGVD